jgi:hypothetical protein
MVFWKVLITRDANMVMKMMTRMTETMPPVMVR